jgi:hypothetical protein
VTFKEFSNEKATTKAKKAAASSKGFGAAAPKQAGAAAAAVTPATELSAEQLTAVLSCNTYGDDHLDGGLTCCRQEQQGSIIGASNQKSFPLVALQAGHPESSRSVLRSCHLTTSPLKTGLCTDTDARQGRNSNRPHEQAKVERR